MKSNSKIFVRSKLVQSFALNSDMERTVKERQYHRDLISEWFVSPSMERVQKRLFVFVAEYLEETHP